MPIKDYLYWALNYKQDMASAQGKITGSRDRTGPFTVTLLSHVKVGAKHLYVNLFGSTDH